MLCRMGLNRAVYLKTGFVSRTRTYVSGLKSRMLGACVLPEQYSHIPSMPYPTFCTFQPVPHFPGSQCLVFYSLRDCYLLCATRCIISPTQCYLFALSKLQRNKLGGCCKIRTYSLYELGYSQPRLSNCVEHPNFGRSGGTQTHDNHRMKVVH